MKKTANRSKTAIIQRQALVTRNYVRVNRVPGSLIKSWRAANLHGVFQY